MVPPELSDYLKKQLAAGYSRDALRRVLLSSGGWSEQDVNEAFAALDAQPAGAGTPPSNPPAPQPAASVQPAPAPQRSRARWPIVFAIVVILLVIAGGAAAYVALVKNAATPTEILKRAFAATAAEPSFSFTSTTTDEVLAASSTPRQKADISLAIGGKVDRHDAESPAVDLTFSGAFSGAMASGTISVSGALHAISVNKKFYFNLTKASVSFAPSDSSDVGDELGAAMASGLAQSIENKWFEIDASSTAKVASTSPALMADERALISYLQGASYVTMSQNAGRESVQGVPTEHLKFTLTFEQQLAEILSHITQDQSASVSDELQSVRVPSTQLSALAALSSADASSTAVVQSSLQKLVGQQASIDVWVGTSDSLIYKFALEPLTFTDAGSGITNTLSVEATYGDWGKQFSITPPGNAEPLQEFLEDEFDGLFGTSTASSSPLLLSSTTPSGSATQGF